MSNLLREFIEAAKKTKTPVGVVITEVCGPQLKPMKASYLASIAKLCWRQDVLDPKWEREFDSDKIYARVATRILDRFGFDEAMKTTGHWEYVTYSLENLMIQYNDPDHMDHCDTGVADLALFALDIEEELVVELCMRGFTATRTKEGDAYTKFNVTLADATSDIVSGAAPSVMSGATHMSAEEDVKSIIAIEVGCSIDNIDDVRKHYARAVESLDRKRAQAKDEIAHLLACYSEVPDTDVESYQAYLRAQQALEKQCKTCLDLLRAVTI